MSNELYTAQIVQLLSAGATQPIQLFYVSQSNGSLIISGANNLTYVDGNQAAGFVLTSDANGVASWAADQQASGFVPAAQTASMLAPYTPNSVTASGVATALAPYVRNSYTASMTVATLNSGSGFNGTIDISATPKIYVVNGLIWSSSAA